MARSRPSDRTVFDLGQPCETDGANPFSSSADARVHHRDRCGSLLGTLRVAMPRTSESGERNRAIGAHFPEVADIARGRRSGGSPRGALQTGYPSRLQTVGATCNRSRRGSAIPRGGNNRSEPGITDLARNVHVARRGLPASDRISTQTSTATSPCGNVTQLNWPLLLLEK